MDVRQPDRLEVGRGGFGRVVLVIASLKVSASIFERHRRESITPGVLFGEGSVPEFFRSRKGRKYAFRPALHVDAVNALAVRGIREPNFQFVSVILCLADRSIMRCAPARLRFLRPSHSQAIDP